MAITFVSAVRTHLAGALAIALSSAALLGAGQPPDAEPLAKLIAQLGSADFRVRDQANAALVKRGDGILPTLRKAATGKIDLETKRRIENVIIQIETGLLEKEDKHWQSFDQSRRDLKVRLLHIQKRMQPDNEAQLAAAVYLLCLARPPSAEEAADAKKQLASSPIRALPLLRLARVLLKDQQAGAGIAAANARMLKFQKELAGEGDYAARLHRLNTQEVQKLAEDVGASLHKAVQADEPLVDIAFLIVLSRFPDAKSTKLANEHLKKDNRALKSADIIWATINTKEFMTLAP